MKKDLLMLNIVKKSIFSKYFICIQKKIPFKLAKKYKRRTITYFE